MSTTPPPPPPPPSEEPKSLIKENSICQVCGDNAATINYGGLSCLSCRTFFRRNAFPTKKVTPCQFEGHCEVNVLTRKVCTACRLAKCLAVGMSSELIRKQDLSSTKRKSTKCHSKEVVVDPPVMTVLPATALDLSSGNIPSYLTSSEWNVISNVMHAFATFSPVPEIRRTIEIITTSASSRQFDLSQSLNILSLFYHSLQSFISSTPDFKVLTLGEQTSLLQRNMLGLLSLGGMYLMRECGIFSQPEHEMAILPLYGNEMFQRAKIISEQLDSDSTVIQLLLVALAFSSNCSTVHTTHASGQDSLLFGTFRLFGSQNVYAELIWKYLMHRYGMRESVQRLSRIVKPFLDVLTLSSDIFDSNSVFQRFITDLREQGEQFVNLNEKTLIPLWGKK